MWMTMLLPFWKDSLIDRGYCSRNEALSEQDESRDGTDTANSEKGSEQRGKIEKEVPNLKSGNKVWILLRRDNESS
jgi:hypothetical protein